MSSELPLAHLLRDATIAGPDGPVLLPTTLSLRDRCVTVLLGPAGVGKSLFLRALSGRAPVEGFGHGGTWSHRGDDAPFDSPSRGLGGVAWLDQRRRTNRDEPIEGDWSRCFAGQARTVLLDEPDRSVTHEERGPLIAALRRHAETGAAVVVTHDVSFARAVADEVILFCAGRIRAREPAVTFFASPRTALSRQYVVQGNCWPDGPAPDLPSHFQWIVPGRLAGLGLPGLLGPPEDDLAALGEAGISLLISLTERPYPSARLAPYGIEPLHFPIQDMGVPGLRATVGLCSHVTSALRAGRGVAVHCRAGLGRTGTVLAAIVLWLRLARPEVVVEELRALGPRYVQSQAQRDFVRVFAEYAGL